MWIPVLTGEDMTNNLPAWDRYVWYPSAIELDRLYGGGASIDLQPGQQCHIYRNVSTQIQNSNYIQYVA